jgi:ketosteroid isomerase-like protein
MANTETVQQIYTAFGRGDIRAILERLADDVEWEYGVNATEVPWLQPRHGRAAVAGFFQSLAALEFHRFEPKTFLESGSVVVVLIDLEATVKATGQRIVEEDEAHIWHFDARGQVCRFRHRVDTHQHRAAWRGDGAPGGG